MADFTNGGVLVLKSASCENPSFLCNLEPGSVKKTILYGNSGLVFVQKFGKSPENDPYCDKRRIFSLTVEYTSTQ